MNKWLILAVVGAVCNLFDAFFTWYMVGHGYAVELNPVMRALLVCPAAFLLVKFASCGFFWYMYKKSCKSAILFCSSLYILLVAYQIVSTAIYWV